MILALDTATRQAGLALYDGDFVRYECVRYSADKFHTEWLVPAIEHALVQGGSRAAELSGVAVTRGPGSYTGIRVALSVAKGLVAALNIPIVGINALDVIAQPFSDSSPVCAAVPLGRGRFAFGFYPPQAAHDGSTMAEPEVGELSAIEASISSRFPGATVRVSGEFSSAERNRLRHSNERIEVVEPPLAVRRPSILAMMARDLLLKGQSDDPHTLEPLYLQL